VDKKFLTYSVEELSQDLHFISWIKNGDNNKKWEGLIKEHPEFSKKTDAAKKLVETLRFSKIEDISSEELRTIYTKLENHANNSGMGHKVIRLKTIVRYAAIFIVLLSLAGTARYFLQKNNSNMFSIEAIENIASNDSKLILPDGKEILLEEKESDLQFNGGNNQVKIDRDSIIELKKDQTNNSLAQVITPYGKRSNITLADGTRVWLNAGSKFAFPQQFNENERKVFLQGEAYFEVTKNKNVPFIVSTDKINVKVYGTQFNVKDLINESETEVVLVEGSVGLKRNGIKNFLEKETKLEPMQKALFDKNSNDMTVESNVDVTRYISWKDGYLDFHEENLEKVFNKLSKYYNINFKPTEKIDLKKQITGKLDLKESLDEVLKVVSDLAPVSFQIDSTNIFVSKKMELVPK